MGIGELAYHVVYTYSEMGMHRTGSAGDHKTANWLGQALTDHGARVSFQTFRYPHFEAFVDVESAGRSVSSMALHYAWTGKRDMVNPATGIINAHADEKIIARQITGMMAEVKMHGHDGLVIGTKCPTGDLCAINRTPGEVYEVPVILVPPDELHGIAAGGAGIRYSATVRDGEASNVIARFQGPGDAGTIVITTPVSGWFHCAGERGAGIAVAIMIAKRLSQQFTVHLLFASGHELGFDGGYRLAEKFTDPPNCVIHIGSCIANIDAELISTCSAEPATANRVAAALQPLGVTTTEPADASDPDCWAGEAKCWAPKGWPMLSIAGQAPHFHTPGDIPDAVTTPQLLEAAIEAIGDAALATAAG